MYITKVPELDALILDRMDDDALMRYCQTSTTNQDLCRIGRIQRRIDTYKRYLEFDHDTIMDYLTIPCMLIRRSEIDNQDIYYNTVDIFILERDRYYYVGYIGSKDEHNQYNVTIQDFGWQNQPLTVENILSQNVNYNYDMDVKSREDIYKRLGFERYAKKEVELYLNYFENVRYERTYQSFFEIMAIHLTLKMQCIYLDLIDEHVYDVDYSISPNYFYNNDGRMGANALITDILYYIDLLKYKL